MLVQLCTTPRVGADSLASTCDVHAFDTHARAPPQTHRRTAEYINGRVQWASSVEAALLVSLSVFQVLYLRSLFAGRPDVPCCL